MKKNIATSPILTNKETQTRLSSASFVIQHGSVSITNSSSQSQTGKKYN